MKKYFFFIILFFLFLGIIYFFLFNNLYKMSLKARMYYSIGDYNKAYILSREVYLKDPYNTMSLTVMNGSKVALKYIKYIKEGNKYLKQIASISRDKKVSRQQLAKIKIICEIMIGEYDKLKPNIFSDEKLSSKASNIYKKFKKIYEELF